MTEDHNKKLEQKLWNIANELRGKMNNKKLLGTRLGTHKLCACTIGMQQ